jgi:hypothetical protein
MTKFFYLPFFRRYLAIYLSLTLLGLGAGIGRAGDKKPFFNTPPSHELRLDKIPKPPMEFSLSGYDGSEQQYKFSLAPQNGAGFSLVPDRTAMDLSAAHAAGSLEGIVKGAPSPLQNKESQQTPAALYKGEKQETEKKSPWWKWPLIIIGVAAATYGVYELVKKKPVPVPTPTYKETTQTGTIKDVLTNATLAGIVLEYDDINKDGATVHETYTTNGSGIYTIQFKENTQPKITISDPNSRYVARNTFPKFGVDYTLIPATFDMVTFNNVCRNDELTLVPHVTKRWTKQPKYYIGNTDMDDTTKGIIKDVLSTNEIPLLTGGKIQGTTAPEEGPSLGGSKDGYVVIEFVNNISPIAVTSTYYDSNYSLTKMWVQININRKKEFVRGVFLHEIGHVMGHYDHAHKQMLMGGAGYVVPYITQFDIDNGTVLYSRPTGNAAPDDDLLSGVDWSGQSTVAAAGMRSMVTMFTVPQVGLGGNGVSIGSLKLPGNRSGRVTLADLVAILPDIQVRNGSFGLALNPAMGQTEVGFSNEKGGVTTSLRNFGYGPLESITTAAVKEGKFNAGFQMVHSPWQQLYQAGAQVEALPGVNVLVFDAYDAKRQANTLNVGTSLFDKKLQLSYGSQIGGNIFMQVFNAQTQFGIGKVLVNANGSVAKYNPDELSLALNLSTKLGTAVVLGSYSHEQLRQMSQDFGRLAVMLPLGPGFVDASLFKIPGQNPGLSAKYTVQIVF